MDKTQATKTVQLLASIADDVNKLHEASELFASDLEKRKFRRHLGEIMATINGDMLMPIFERYPDLALAVFDEPKCSRARE